MPAPSAAGPARGHAARSGSQAPRIERHRPRAGRRARRRRRAPCASSWRSTSHQVEARNATPTSVAAHDSGARYEAAVTTAVVSAAAISGPRRSAAARRGGRGSSLRRERRARERHLGRAPRLVGGAGSRQRAASAGPATGRSTPFVVCRVNPFSMGPQAASIPPGPCGALVWLPLAAFRYSRPACRTFASPRSSWSVSSPPPPRSRRPPRRRPSRRTWWCPTPPWPRPPPRTATPT